MGFAISLFLVTFAVPILALLGYVLYYFGIFVILFFTGKLILPAWKVIRVIWKALCLVFHVVDRALGFVIYFTFKFILWITGNASIYRNKHDS